MTRVADLSLLIATASCLLGLPGAYSFLAPIFPQQQQHYVTTTTTTTTTTTRRFVSSKQTPASSGSEILSENAVAGANANLFTPSPEDSSSDFVPQVFDDYGDIDVTSAAAAAGVFGAGGEYDEDPECMIGTEAVLGQCLPLNLVTLPRHPHEKVNGILAKTEKLLREMHVNSTEIELTKVHMAKEAGRAHERIYANNYVDLGKIDTVGFDFDYTLVTYTDELLELIYEKALARLITDRQYPTEMAESGLLKYDPLFSIRGLAVDKETGWITHLSYTHKVAVAWEGREKLPTSRIFEEYRGKRALTPTDRKKRLKPLNDLFSMAECCLIADTIQFFKDRDIPYCAQNVVTDVLNSVTATHLSGDFHRLVAENPQRYFDPTPHLKDVLRKLKESGKRLIFVSNSPFWYVDAGMRYVFGGSWRKEWDAIITSAGKPNFYTDDSRPFREVCQETGRLNFNRVEKFESGKVYTEGCLRELTRLMDWSKISTKALNDEQFTMRSGTHEVATPNALYIGDSLFADLVDAKREFGWTTAAVTPEVGFEAEIQNQPDFALTQKSIDLLLNALRRLQDELGSSIRTEDDILVLNSLESLVSLWRDRETMLLGNPFGSVFRARYQPSLFAHSLKRYCDLYMTSVSSLRHYSPQHRFYPEHNHRLLAHEISHMNLGQSSWALDEDLKSNLF